MANRISVIIDVVADQATQSFGKLKQSISDADGAANKFKAGAAGAFESVKQNAGNLALAAGTALVAFGVQAVSAFQETALAAGELRDKLGLTAEEASRFVEVAGDMGINVADLESTIGRMNREAANSPGRFDAIGASIVRNKDGTINTKNTFLSVVDALNQMPDAAQRAKAGQEIFGRSWMNIAEMVGQGAEGMQEALDSVETNKVIDDAEIEEARRYRDALDGLKGVSEDLTISVGSYLVPVVADLAEGLQIVAEKGRDLGGIIPTQITKPLGMLADQVQRSLMPWKYYTDFFGQAAETTGTLGDMTGDMTGKMIDATGAVVDITTEVTHYGNILSDTEIAAGRVAAATEASTARMEAAWDSLNQELSDRSAYLDIEDALANVEAAYLTAMDTGDKSLSEQEADTRNLERAVIDLRGKVNDYAQEIAGLPPEYGTEIQALIDEGAFQEVERRLATLEKMRTARITAEVYMPSNTRVPGARSHTGSRFEAGEAKAVIPGQQVFVPDGPGRMYSPAESQRMLGGGGTTKVEMTLNATPDIGRDAARAFESMWWKLGAR